MTTAVWMCEPRTHGRRKAATPLPGRTPSAHVFHRSASPALCPRGHAASFSSSYVVVRAWRLEFCGAATATGGGAVRARAAHAARSAACSRVLLSCGCRRCCDGVCAAILATSGARAAEGARAVIACVVGARAGCWGGGGGCWRPVLAAGGAWRHAWRRRRSRGVRAPPLLGPL